MHAKQQGISGLVSDCQGVSHWLADGMVVSGQLADGVVVSGWLMEGPGVLVGQATGQGSALYTLQCPVHSPLH